MHAVMWSGGKDSYLALVRAKRQGLSVGTLVNLYDGPTGRVRFHATRKELIEAQAFALGLRLHQHATTAESYETAFHAALRQLAATGCPGVVYGNIHLADVRAWFEERVRAQRLEHHEPLWGNPPAALLDEFVDSGARAVVTCVEIAKLPTSWLGRPLFAQPVAWRPGPIHEEKGFAQLELLSR